MTAKLVQTAQAVVDELNAASLSVPLTATRSYRPIFDLQEMKDLHVTVVPKKVTVSQSARTLQAFEYEIDVAVQKRLEGDDMDDADELVGLVEEVGDLFRFKRLDAYPKAHWIKTEVVAIPAPEHLHEMRQFTGVLTLTFREAV